MIVSKQKELDDIIKKIRGSVFIFGCGICSDTSRTGGPKEVEAMKNILTGRNIAVEGTYVIDAMCHLQKVRKAARDNKEGLSKSQTVLVLSCGSGVQSTVLALPDNIKVVSGVDTMFLGNIENLSSLKEMCSLCGNCVLNETGGICPVTLCPKGLLNGPCGGMKNYKCEIDENMDCAWVKIYERSVIQNTLEDIKKTAKPKDYSVKKPAAVIKFTGSHK
ncbi:MAG: methylenetetrahydrofolate reductase C-terminal domain-containing protein [Deltaproteobacteria bacterium]|nr:methylenetetrahydrofolate reductase C-terminal domain-containing protein [Deltaproteobacteria bacterium]